MTRVVKLKPPKAPKKKAKFRQFPNRVLVYCDFGCTTGFGNVAKELLDRWHIQFPNTEFIVVGINHAEKDVAMVINTENFREIPACNLAQVEGEAPDFPYFRQNFIYFLDHIDTGTFDALFILNDLEVICPMVPTLQKVKDLHAQNDMLFPKTFFYFPIDSIPNPNDIANLSFFDEIMTYTEYAKDVVTQFDPEQGNRLQVVPHGVDTNAFFQLPLCERLAIKNDMFGENKFVVGTVNRNSARKDPAATMLAFHEAFRTENVRTDAVLYMHMNPTDYTGVNLVHLASTLGLEIGKDVFFPPAESFNEQTGVSVAELNKIYNTFDIFVTTSTAEGWGLTVTEAMACKIPIIAPMHTALAEICGGEAVPHITGPLHELDPTVFVFDGAKIRFKSTVAEISRHLDIEYDLSKMPTTFDDADDIRNFGKQHVRDSFEFVEKLTWEKTADRISANFTKHIEKLS